MPRAMRSNCTECGSRRYLISDLLNELLGYCFEQEELYESVEHERHKWTIWSVALEDGIRIIEEKEQRDDPAT